MTELDDMSILAIVETNPLLTQEQIDYLQEKIQRRVRESGNMAVQLSDLHKVAQGGVQVKEKVDITKEKEPIKVQIKPEAMELIVQICVDAMLRDAKKGEQS